MGQPARVLALRQQPICLLPARRSITRLCCPGWRIGCNPCKAMPRSVPACLGHTGQSACGRRSPESRAGAHSFSAKLSRIDPRARGARRAYTLPVPSYPFAVHLWLLSSERAPMGHKWLATVSVVAMLAAGSAKADLIVNGGFETRDFTGWALSGETGFTHITNIVVHSGSSRPNLAQPNRLGSYRRR